MAPQGNSLISSLKMQTEVEHTFPRMSCYCVLFVVTLWWGTGWSNNHSLITTLQASCTATPKWAELAASGVTLIVKLTLVSIQGNCKKQKQSFWKINREGGQSANVWGNSVPQAFKYPRELSALFSISIDVRGNSNQAAARELNLFALMRVFC